jgi:RND family efflux transporter MFP subunit
MKTKRIVPITFLVVLGITGWLFRAPIKSWLTGGRESRQAAASPAQQASSAPASAAEPQEEVYYCPMHPHYRTHRPGNCPICSMKLVKLEAGAEAGVIAGKPQEPAQQEQAAHVFIAPERQQMIGVRLATVERKALSREIRAVGKVAADETRITHIHTKVTGYIEEVFVDFIGRPVKRGEPLFTIYSPELVATQQEYLIALRGRKQLEGAPYQEVAAGAESLVNAARDRLRLWDISEAELGTLEKEGKVKRALTIYSPVEGVVTDRMAYHHGRYVDPQMDLYTIVDLSRVWVLAEVYEHELPYVRLGQGAEVEFPYGAGARKVWGRVSFIQPFLNPKTRTAQVRLEFANPGLALKPEMFVNVKLSAGLGTHLVVPEDAVVDTGTEQYVFVDKGEGYLEPRRVEVVAEAGGYLAIHHGLAAGERVATAANFLIDSESRLKGALAQFGKPAAQPNSHAGHGKQP